MKLIERYILKKMTLTTLLILGSLSGVVWIVQAIREIDIIATNGQTILTFLSMTSLAVPNLVVAIIPVALLLAAIHTINTMNGNSELVVVSASGFSNWRIAKPMLILALIASLLTGIVGHVVSPWSLVKLKEYITEMRADLVSLIVREGAFNGIDDGLTFHVAQRGAGGILKGILISDDREEDVSTIYSAKDGFVTRTELGSFMLLKDGEIQQTNLEDGSVTLVRYQSYVFDLSSFSGETTTKPQRPKELMTWDLISPDPNDPAFQRSPGKYRSQLHERFSEMLWPFAYVMIVLAFAGQARSSRQSHSASIATAAICVVVAKGFGFSAVNGLKTDPLAVYFVYGLPLSCIFFGAWFVIANRPAELPKTYSDKLDQMVGRFTNTVDVWIAQYRQYQRRRAGVSS